MGSDGASNMVGRKSGLSTLLRQDIGEHFVNVHCLSHRLELAFRDAVKSLRLYDKLMTLLIGLHYFYRKQYKNKRGLLNTFKALSVKGGLPPKVTGTRWLPHLMNGMESLLRNYIAYDHHLGNTSHGNAKAEGLARLMKDRSVISFVLSMQVL